MSQEDIPTLPPRLVRWILQERIPKGIEFGYSREEQDLSFPKTLSGGSEHATLDGEPRFNVLGMNIPSRKTPQIFTTNSPVREAVPGTQPVIAS